MAVLLISILKTSSTKSANSRKDVVRVGVSKKEYADRTEQVSKHKLGNNKVGGNEVSSNKVDGNKVDNEVKKN